MKVILAMVMSVDDKSTEGQNSNIYQWTSKEDQTHFFSLIEKYSAIIMGRKTFLGSRPVMKLSPKKLRLVMTRSPQKYMEYVVPTQLEFTSASPKQILTELVAKGYTEVLLVGGAEVNTSFFSENLVNELWLTIEPVLLGQGNGIVADALLNIPLQLLSSKVLNKQGTILLHYKVI